LVASYVLSASAIFIKPVSLFGIYSVFVMLAIGKYGKKETISDFRSILFIPVTLLPALIFYLYGLFVARSLQAQAEASFLPQLLFTPFFWRGWLNNIHEVVGFTAFIVSLIGVLLVRKGVARLLLLGLWVGYALFCLVFSYHIATHDYYHLQLVPIVAISLSPVAALIVERLLESDPDPYWRWALASILSLALLLSLAVARAGLLNPGYENKVRMAEEIGELVQHSTNTAYLAADYGLSLEYHGELSGQPWPLVSDLEWEHLAGVPVLEAGARFDRLFGKQLPQYFIVEEMNEFDQQQDLKQFLLHDYAVLAEQDSFVVYELR
jgi:hypothetical protein